MKKASKIFLIIAFVFMGLGVILSVGAFVAADFDLSAFGYTEKDLIEQSADIEGKDIYSLYIDDIFGGNMSYEIILKPSADEDFHLYYLSDKADDILWTAENGTLRIFSPFSEWYHNIVLFDFIDIVPLTIEVPASVSGIQCNADAAKVTAESFAIEGLLDFHCNADAADVTLRDMKLNSLLLNSDAADIDLERITASGSVDIHCDAGDVKIKDFNAEHSVCIEADTCNVELENVSVGKNLELTADTGNVELNMISANCILIDMNVGDLDFDSLFVTASLEITSDIGDIRGTVNDSRDAFTVFRPDELEETNLFAGGNGPKIMRVNSDAYSSVYVDFLK